MFTTEELEELRRFDALIDAPSAEATASRKAYRAAHKAEIAARKKAYYEAHKKNVAG